MSAIENVVNRMKRVMNMAAFVRGLMTRLTQRIAEMLRRNREAGLCLTIATAFMCSLWGLVWPFDSRQQTLF
jgi:hypothetical protein